MVNDIPAPLNRDNKEGIIVNKNISPSPKMINEFKKLLERDMNK